MIMDARERDLNVVQDIDQSSREIRRIINSLHDQIRTKDIEIGCWKERHDKYQKAYREEAGIG